jgi:uncharacterized protein (TIRG00374 family)
MGRRAKWALKLAFSATLIVVLLWQFPVSGADLHGILRSANFAILAVALVLLLNQTLLSASKWQLILRSHGMDFPLSGLFRSYLIGSFFSTFLPSSYGGDLVRISDVARSTGRTFESAAAVVLERLSGLAALTGVGAIASVYIANAYEQPSFFWLAAMLAGILVMLVTVFTPGVLGLAAPVVNRIPVGALHKLFHKVENVVRHYVSEQALIAKILLISLAFQVLAYTIFFLYMKAVNVDVPYLYCLAFVPILYLLEALPVSVAGIGLREAGLIYFLGLLGLSSAEAIAVSIVAVAMRYAVNLTGGVMFAFRRELPMTQTGNKGAS